MNRRNARLKALGEQLTELNYQIGCAFNFHYYDKTQPESVSKENLDFCLSWLKTLSGKGTAHWANETIAGSKKHKNKRFKKLSNFNFTKSAFKEPQGLPEDIEWAEFYLSAKFRLVGFTQKVNTKPEDLDVFYVVFIDPDHDFWEMTKK